MSALTLTDVVGTKFIRASELITKKEYCTLRGWDLPQNEDPNEIGRLVVYSLEEGQKANVEGYDGYVSWSPEASFAVAYRESGRMNFGHALEAMKRDKKVARSGWNGKGMFVWVNKGAFDGPALGFSNGEQPDRPNSGVAMNSVAIELFEASGQGTVTRMPNLNMRAADGSTITGWLASQTDMLAEDWCIVE